MRKKFRITQILLVFVLCISLLAGCGQGTSEATNTESDTAQTEVESTQDNSESAAYTTEELFFYRDNLKIYGQLMRPKGDGPFPLIILSHGYAGNYNMCTALAQKCAENGMLAYVFDYNGGGRNSKSEGKSTDMSVLTEAADLNAIIDGFMEMPEVDTDRIILGGYSQGGFISSYVAATRPDDIKALVAYFPAYVLQDDAKKALAEMETVPAEFDFMGLTITRRYYDDALSFDIYELMPNYTSDVLLLHGTSDPLVPISYSQRAVETFPSAELITVEGGSHGMLGDDADASALEFILNHAK